MTVRELINTLLDKQMDSEVVLETFDPHRKVVSGVIFHIDKVSQSRQYPTIHFTDWRDEVDKREVTE